MAFLLRPWNSDNSTGCFQQNNVCEKNFLQGRLVKLGDKYYYCCYFTICIYLL